LIADVAQGDLPTRGPHGSVDKMTSCTHIIDCTYCTGTGNGNRLTKQDALQKLNKTVSDMIEEIQREEKDD